MMLSEREEETETKTSSNRSRSRSRSKKKTKTKTHRRLSVVFICCGLSYFFRVRALFLSSHTNNVPVTVVAILKKMAPETPSPATKGQLFLVFDLRKERVRDGKKKTLDDFFCLLAHSFLGHTRPRHETLCFVSPLPPFGTSSVSFLHIQGKKRQKSEFKKEKARDNSADERATAAAIFFLLLLLHSARSATLFERTETYSFLTSFTAVVRAGSVASACGGKRGIAERGVDAKRKQEKESEREQQQQQWQRFFFSFPHSPPATRRKRKKKACSSN